MKLLIQSNEAPRSWFFQSTYPWVDEHCKEKGDLTYLQQLITVKNKIIIQRHKVLVKLMMKFSN